METGDLNIQMITSLWSQAADPVSAQCENKCPLIPLPHVSLLIKRENPEIFHAFTSWKNSRFQLESTASFHDSCGC